MQLGFIMACASRSSLFLTLSVALSLVVLTGCATLTGQASGKKKEEADLRMRIGTSFLSQGNYPAAMRELLRAEEADPRNEAVQNNLGLAYFMRERYELALQHLKRALELKPTYSEARNNYARVLIEVERYNEAIPELEKVIDDLTYDDPAKAWVNLGLVYFKKKEFETAKGKFAEAIRINRDHCLAQTLYGRSLLELGRMNVAADALDNAVVVCRPAKYDEPHYYSGLAYYRLGRTSSAIARMEEVVKFYPQGTYAKKAESMLKLMR